MATRGLATQIVLLETIRTALPDSHDAVSKAAQLTGLTRQAIHRHLRNLRDEGLIAQGGTRRKPTYALVILAEQTGIFPITPTVGEHDVFNEVIRPLLQSVGENARQVVEYAFSEMCNNAIDHSGSVDFTVMVEVTAAGMKFVVADRGIGIFRKIKDECGLESERQAVFELSKGKLTTDTAHHTGEGIFFTARMVDDFAILSKNLMFRAGLDADDWLIGDHDETGSVGTYVQVFVSAYTPVRPVDIFNKFTSDEEGDHSFSKTNVVVRLAKTGEESFVSRSQARRILQRLNRFRSIIFDFSGVEQVSPAFADQIFRVFARENPEISISTSKTNEMIGRMISKAIEARLVESNS